MSFLTVFCLAVALSMDAFAVAVASACALVEVRSAHYARLSASFGFFQFLMPVIGWLLGATVRSYVEAWDHWIAFGLLAWVGGSMLWQAWKEYRGLSDGEGRADPTNLRSLILLGIATSIDALAVGISFALLEAPILWPSILIGIVCAAITALGVFLGKKLSGMSALEAYAGVIGGLTLLGIAVNTLREHHVFG